MSPALDSGQRWPLVSAPGKAMLAGEYGVLEGGEAVVMAVSARGQTTGASSSAPGPLERACLAAAREALGDDAEALPPGAPTLDLSALQGAPGQKLGLGSSAAAAACLAGAALSAAGVALDTPAGRERALALALSGHQQAGGGSGADVAAAVLGGVIRFRAGAPLPHTAPLPLSETWTPWLLWGGRAVSSRALLAALDRSARRGALLSSAKSVGADLIAALAGSDPDDLCVALSDARRVLCGLAEALDPAVAGWDHLEAIDRALAPFGGRAKPSGASGAELAVAFTPSVDAHDRPRVAAALRAAGLHLLPLSPEAEGLTHHALA